MAENGLKPSTTGEKSINRTVAGMFYSMPNVMTWVKHPSFLGLNNVRVTPCVKSRWTPRGKGNCSILSFRFISFAITGLRLVLIDDVTAKMARRLGPAIYNYYMLVVCTSKSNDGTECYSPRSKLQVVLTS